MTITKSIISLAALAIATACSEPGGARVDTDNEDDRLASGLRPEKFECTVDSNAVALYTLTNSNGMEVSITNYGARVVSIMVPGRDGTLRDVVTGMDSIGQYIASGVDWGEIAGRWAGEIDSKKLSLPQRRKSWGDMVWKTSLQGDSMVRMSLIVKPTADGWTGGIQAQVDYSLNDDNTLMCNITAMADRETWADISPRLYFNLMGVGDSTVSTVDEHIITSKANEYVRRDSMNNITGETLMTIWTGYDFRNDISIRRFLKSDFDQKRWAHGLKAYMRVPVSKELSPREMLTMRSPSSGVKLTVLSTYPGFDIATADNLDGKVAGKHGNIYQKGQAVLIMPHYLPDAPNRQYWGIFGRLRPGEIMNEEVIYHFSVSED